VNREKEFKAFIGIDWANAKHDICLQSSTLKKHEYLVLPNKVSEIDAWSQGLHYRFKGKIAVGIELSKGPVVYALQKFDFFVIFPIHPATLAKYRETFTPSRAKDDPTDALLAVELIRRFPEKFKRLNPQSKEMRALSNQKCSKTVLSAGIRVV